MHQPARRTPRVGCHFPVRWRRRNVECFGTARLCNAHGLFIVSTVPAQLGYVVDFTLAMPDSTVEISFTGVTRFMGATPLGHGLGVALHVMDAADRVRWERAYRTSLEGHLAGVIEPLLLGR